MNSQVIKTVKNVLEADDNIRELLFKSHLSSNELISALDRDDCPLSTTDLKKAQKVIDDLVLLEKYLGKNDLIVKRLYEIAEDLREHAASIFQEGPEEMSVRRYIESMHSRLLIDIERFAGLIRRMEYLDNEIQIEREYLLLFIHELSLLENFIVSRAQDLRDMLNIVFESHKNPDNCKTCI